MSRRQDNVLLVSALTMRSWTTLRKLLGAMREPSTQEDHLFKWRDGRCLKRWGLANFVFWIQTQKNKDGPKSVIRCEGRWLKQTFQRRLPCTIWAVDNVPRFQDWEAGADKTQKETEGWFEDGAKQGWEREVSMTAVRAKGTNKNAVTLWHH